MSLCRISVWSPESGSRKTKKDLSVAPGFQRTGGKPRDKFTCRINYIRLCIHGHFIFNEPFVFIPPYVSSISIDKMDRADIFIVMQIFNSFFFFTSSPGSLKFYNSVLYVLSNVCTCIEQEKFAFSKRSSFTSSLNFKRCTIFSRFYKALCNITFAIVEIVYLVYAISRKIVYVSKIRFRIEKREKIFFYSKIKLIYFAFI